MDLYSRKIIERAKARHCRHHIKSNIQRKQREPARSPSYHTYGLCRIRYNTDRGCQYVSDAFRQATDGMINSYSKKAYPWDNACIESFHALLKREWINRFKIFNYRHAYKLVFEYIETFYNTVRIHSHCGYLSPDQYEEKYYAALDEKAEALAG